MESDTARRARAFTRTISGALALWLIVPARTSAQEAPRPVPVTWCDAVATKPEWALQTVFLELTDRTRTPTGERAAPHAKDALTDVLLAIVSQYRALPGFASSEADAVSATPATPDIGTRYSPGALFGMVGFEMTSDAHMSAPVLADARDTLFAHDIARAYAAVAATRPANDSLAPRHQLVLSATLAPDSSVASWPLFRMFVPRTRPVTVVNRGLWEFPREYLGWSAKVQLAFVVDTAGRVEPESVHAFPPPEQVVFDDKQKRGVYEGLIRYSTDMMRKARFAPAEVLGCRVRQGLQVPLQFTTR